MSGMTQKLLATFEKRFGRRKSLAYLAFAGLVTLLLSGVIASVSITLERNTRFDAQIEAASNHVSRENFKLAETHLKRALEIDPSRAPEVESERLIIRETISDIASSQAAYLKARKYESKKALPQALKHYRLVGEHLFDLDEKAAKRIMAIENTITRDALIKAKQSASRRDYSEAIKIVRSAQKLLPDNEKLSAAQEHFEEQKEAYDLARALAKLRQKYDAFSGVTIYKDFSSPQYINRTGFYLFIAESDGSKQLRLKMQYYADDWLFIEKARVLADGEVINLADTSFERDNNSRIWEWLTIDIYDGDSNELIVGRNSIEKIARSKNAIVRYTGSNYYDERYITDTEKQAMLNVLSAYDKLPD